MSEPSTITSPRLMPMRNRMRCAWGGSGSWLEISCWISTAHCTASTTLANSAMTASPQVLTIRPSWRSTNPAMAARWRRSVANVPVSSASMRREYPCTSAHRTVVSRRFTLSSVIVAMVASPAAKCMRYRLQRQSRFKGWSWPRTDGDWSGQLLDQPIQDEINALRHAGLWQDRDFVTQRRVNFEKARILADRRLKTMTALGVLHIDLGPGRRQKYAPMVAVGLTELLEQRLACQMLKARGGIDQASVEENPTVRGDCRRPVRKGHRDGATQKGCLVHPRQRQAVARQRVVDDPPSRFVHDSVAASAELGEQCRFAAA